MKQKRKKKSRKKSRFGKMVLIVLLLGISGTLLFLFRQELFDSTKPWLEKKGHLQGEEGSPPYFSIEKASI